MSEDRSGKIGPAGVRLSRRKFAVSMGLAAGAVGLGTMTPAAWADRVGKLAKPKKVVLIGTHVIKMSHAQHFLDRLLEGYGWQGKWHGSPLELAGIYVDQFPPEDLARERAGRHGVRIYPTIAEALTLGGSTLAVDGVLIIGEHGKYPKNEIGQTLYPRYRWFKEVVRVFERSGRAVPVFNDKHLSTSWSEAAEMVADSKRLGFGFIAGSSLPVTWRLPDLEFPMDCPLAESVSVCYGGVDSYDFHGLETAQCMSERRKGGESGVRFVHARKGNAVWSWLEGRDSTRELLLSALTRSFSLTSGSGYTYELPRFDALRAASPDTVAYEVEHRDGFRTTMFLLNGGTNAVAGVDQKARDALWVGRSVRDFTYAGRTRSGETATCQMYLPMPPWNTSLADFFNPLMFHVEETILNNRSPYPIERTLLTTGMTAAGAESLVRGERVETPHLSTAYRAEPVSQFWRA